MLSTNKQIKEIEAQVEHLQERVDDLGDDLRRLEDFFQHRVGEFIDDRFKGLEDYLNIEFVIEPKKGKYIKKDNKK